MEEQISAGKKYKLKKLVKMLGNIRGRHTELVTVYVPSGYSLHEISTQLKDEQGTAKNIKSKPVRNNVVDALEKIIRHLALYKSAPKNGLAIFAGNISEREGSTDMELWAIEPPEPIKVKLYWCDQKFDLTPLEDMMKEKSAIAIVVLDKSEADIGLLVGKAVKPMHHFESIVPGKTRAGGQCLAPETLVQMSDGNIIEIKDAHTPCTVKSMDISSSDLIDTPVIEKWKTKKGNNLIITTIGPRRQIKSSRDHTFFRWGDKIEEVAAGELKKDDYLLMPEKIEIKGSIQTLNTTELFNSYNISPQGREFIRNKRLELQLLQKDLANKSSVTQTAISIVELGKRDIKIDFLKRLCNNLGIDINYFIRQYCSPVSELKLPVILTEDLAEFLGYFAGDGSLEKERIGLYDEKKQIVEHYTETAKKIFNCNISTTFRENKGHYQARIYGKPIIKLIRNEFPEMKYSGNTDMPEKVLKSPDSVLSAFLRGIFDAEGYVNLQRGIGFGINNKKLASQIQIALMRFGILASLVEYDNRRNPYSNKPRFTISITESVSLKLFLKNIGFNAVNKQENLKKVIESKSKTTYTRRIFATGKNVRNMIETEGLKISDFEKVTNFFRNERMMGKETFEKSILDVVKDNKILHEKLKQVLAYNLIPVRIKSIQNTEMEENLVDIEVKNSNFIANGLVVHNSSARFSRVREGLLNDWLKHTGEAVNKLMSEHPEVTGLLVAGPGPIKNMFIDGDFMQEQFKKKIIGVVDIGTTGEPGLYEAVDRGQEYLKNAELSKEKEILQRFFNELQKTHPKVTYGINETLKAIEMGAVDTVIVSEDADLEEAELECSCGAKKEYVKKGELPKCPICNKTKKMLGEKDLIEAMEDVAKNFGSSVFVVSSETREGSQFLALGGIGALLRYAVEI